MKEHVIQSFLTGAEDRRHALGVCRQCADKSIPGSSSRFKALYQLAYPTDPGPAEYLSGLINKAVARQVFTKLGNEKTVLDAIKLTKEKEQTYECYDTLTSQVRRD